MNEHQSQSGKVWALFGKISLLLGIFWVVVQLVDWYNKTDSHLRYRVQVVQDALPPIENIFEQRFKNAMASAVNPIEIELERNNIGQRKEISKEFTKKMADSLVSTIEDAARIHWIGRDQSIGPNLVRVVLKNDGSLSADDVAIDLEFKPNYVRSTDELAKQRSDDPKELIIPKIRPDQTVTVDIYTNLLVWADSEDNVHVSHSKGIAKYLKRYDFYGAWGALYSLIDEMWFFILLVLLLLLSITLAGAYQAGLNEGKKQPPANQIEPEEKSAK